MLILLCLGRPKLYQRLPQSLYHVNYVDESQCLYFVTKSYTVREQKITS